MAFAADYLRGKTDKPVYAAVDDPVSLLKAALAIRQEPAARKFFAHCNNKKTATCNSE